MVLHDRPADKWSRFSNQISDFEKEIGALGTEDSRELWASEAVPPAFRRGVPTHRAGDGTARAPPEPPVPGDGPDALLRELELLGSEGGTNPFETTDSLAAKQQGEPRAAGTHIRGKCVASWSARGFCKVDPGDFERLRLPEAVVRVLPCGRTRDYKLAFEQKEGTVNYQHILIWLVERGSFITQQDCVSIAKFVSLVGNWVVSRMAYAEGIKVDLKALSHRGAWTMDNLCFDLCVASGILKKRPKTGRNTK